MLFGLDTVALRRQEAELKMWRVSLGTTINRIRNEYITETT